MEEFSADTIMEWVEEGSEGGVKARGILMFPRPSLKYQIPAFFAVELSRF